MDIFYKHIIVVPLCIVCFVLFVDTLRFFYLIKVGERLSQNAIPFERKVDNAHIELLVLGDSTAVGTGTLNNTHSTAGRLADYFPNANLKNMGGNGLKLQGLVAQLPEIDTKKQYEVILLQIGANDIIRFTDMKRMESDLVKVIEYLSTLTDKLIILHSGNVGEARIFPIYSRWALSMRSSNVKDMYTRIALKYGARYVNLIDAPLSVLLRHNPELYYASDRLHLSDEGYGLWFEEIEKQLKSNT